MISVLSTIVSPAKGVWSGLPWRMKVCLRACVFIITFFFVDVLMKPGSLLEQKRKHEKKLRKK